MVWYMDFVGYSCHPQGFIVKEIAILHDSGERCYNYFVTGPRVYPLHQSSVIQYQYNMHRLDWNWGDYEFDEAMADIARKLGEDTVYIKGTEKCKFMCKQLSKPKFMELEDIPAFHTLNNCVHERCNVRHGNHCARRKVYELMYFINNKQESVSKNRSDSLFHQL